MVNTRKELLDIPILLLTSHSEVAKKIRGLEQGASDYVTKPFSPEELLARVKVQLKIKTLQDHLKESNQRLLEMSQIDPLTGLYNRRHMMTTLEAELDRSNRISSPFSLVMVDLDHFKKVNDTHGHDVGDQVLRMVATCLRRVTGGGRAYRYGGEEFAVIFPSKDLERALPHLEALRETIGRAGFVVRGRKRPKQKPESASNKNQGKAMLQVTVSIGVATRDDKNTTPEQLLKAADQALYKAKKGGRNQVCAA